MSADLHGKLEPEADQPLADASACALISIAISLKRIADAIHGDPMNSGMKHMLGDIADRMSSR